MKKINILLKMIFKEKNLFYPNNSRDERARLTAKFFKDHLRYSISVVRSSEGPLKRCLDKDKKYFGIDFNDIPDIIINLEKDKLKIINNKKYNNKFRVCN
jgi:hypothetical protein